MSMAAAGEKQDSGGGEGDRGGLGDGDGYGLGANVAVGGVGYVGGGVLDGQEVGGTVGLIANAVNGDVLGGGADKDLAGVDDGSCAVEGEGEDAGGAEAAEV